MNKQSLLTHLTAFGQAHLLDFWDDLRPEQQQSLAQQIAEIDFAQLKGLYDRREEQSGLRSLLGRTQSPPGYRRNTAQNPHSPDEARQKGEEALRRGAVGAILVAGGQGTRLGFDHPKGMFPIGPLSGKSLFQIHIEKLLAAAARYGAPLPLYLMTSPATHEETLEFLDAHDRFGLPADHLHVFCQGTMPAVDLATGRVLLEAPDRIAQSPDGHGGMLAALVKSGALADIEQRGIEHLFYFQVDNPLVDIGAAEFVGYHLLSGSEMTTQVVAKHDPLERVGNVVFVDGHLQVVEYSDLPDDVAKRRAADGSLEIWAGSIAVHMIAAGLLRRTAADACGLPFHIAKKKVAFVDPSGRRVEPQEPNGVKFERFIFDLIPAARNAIVVEIDPAEGFAPLKNAPGAPRDTAAWVQQQMIAQHRRWLEAAGAKVADGVAVEISPLWAIDAAGVAAKIEPGLRITEPTRFE